VIGVAHGGDWDLELELRGTLLARTNHARVMTTMAMRLSDLPSRAARARNVSAFRNKRKRRSEDDESWLHAALSGQSEDEVDVEVEKILDKRINEEHLNFEWQVKWLGFDGTAEEWTWEPLDCLIGCQKMLEDFESSFPRRKQVDLAQALGLARQTFTIQACEAGSGGPSA